MDYHKADLKDECNQRYFYSFSLMLDKSDYVPERTMKRIGRSLDKDWAQSAREIDREYRRYKWQKFWQDIKARRVERKVINDALRSELNANAISLAGYRVKKKVKRG